MEQYAIQEWLFEEAAGRFSTDLGESGVYRQEASQLSLDPSWDVDYSLDQGSPSLRRLLETLYNSDSGQRTIVTHGGQEALYLYYNVLLGPGDEVVTTTPGWQQSWSVPERLGAQVRKVSIHSDHVGSPSVADSIITAISPRTRLVVLTNPHNPLGMVLDHDSLVRIAAAVRHHGGDLLVDEEYMPDYRSSAVHLGDNITVVSSLSKVHGFPGLRIGWAVGPEQVIRQMINYRRFSTVANSTLSERFAEQVLLQHDKHVERYHRLSESGREVLHRMLDDECPLRPLASQGTPFTWIRVPELVPADHLARKVLKEHRVLVMPSSVFSTDENAVRVTHAREEHHLRAGLEGLLASYHSTLR